MSGTKYVLAFDPGVSSGVALATYSDDEPFDLVEAWQFGGGVQGLLDWIEENLVQENWLVPAYVKVNDFGAPLGRTTIVCEKFVPRSALTLKGSIPLVGEGVLIGRGLMPPYDPQIDTWQAPARQYTPFGGKDLADKKKTARAQMKRLGFYKMPRDLGTPDSDDALSASLHALSYVLHTKKHRPTFDLISGDV